MEAALAAASGRPPVFAICGLQGTGKSTLAAQIAALAQAQGLRIAALSIDDFYLTHAQRRQLARDVHPLLATRGPPGTHDVALALHVLDKLRAGASVGLPRFDKLADDRLPESQWQRVDEPVDLTIFEGWFLATPAEEEAALGEPVNALERVEDSEGTWRRWCNTALARDYPALWARIDALWFLQPPGFEVVSEWRWQQEQALQASDPSRPAMDRTQVERFIQHFERVSRQALRTLPAIADETIPLDAERRPLS
ncbi:kinase [Pseudoxanthomonas helianthi]|uniref:Kinase n=1 Tax=Pseudoxanthomonas helianthi TaxID=1453541 RepID=A0A941ARQ3_9GAMM|nr:kinase [Pseudoxanthomonas helianthi]